MNPDTGRIHAIERDVDDVERIAKGGPKEPTVEDRLARATEKLEQERARSSEPPPGAELPRDWPRFEIGELIGPIKGWWFELVYVDVEEQKLVIQPKEPTRSTKARRVGKKKRRKKRGGRR